MAFINQQNKILREVIQQRVGRFTRRAAVHMPGVVLNSLAVADFLQHFQVKIGALLQPLRLQQAIIGFQHGQPFSQLLADFPQRALHCGVAGDVMAVGINADVGQAVQNLAGDGVHL